MTDAVIDELAVLLDTEITSTARVGGGDVADAFVVDLDDGRRMFAKTHSDPPPSFFTTEATGLRWLGDTDTVQIPEVVLVSDDPPWLVLAWIDEGAARSDTEEKLGRSLATLHQVQVDSFGRPDQRSTGSRGLPNDPADTWAEFYAQNRLAPLAQLARQSKALDETAIQQLERLGDDLTELGIPEEPPSLLHGDLWAGNRLVDVDGDSWLIDPAAHHGSREFDLAMMRLFGGFGDGCYAAYEEAFPLQDGWQDRVAMHQIAPLVVHAIKFGGNYRSAAASAIARYV